jgi:glycosyltransferase involved in cell wall biosynthesis
MRGARFYGPLLRGIAFRSATQFRVRQAAEFGRRQGAELVWGELQGESLLLASGVAESLGVPLAGTVWDDPAGWLADGHYDGHSRRLMMKRFRQALRSAQQLSTAGEAMQEAYQREYGVESVILRHGFARPASAPPDRPGRRDCFTIGFVGNPYGRDAWESLLKGAALVNASGRVARIGLRLFGPGAPPCDFDGVPCEVRGWQPADRMLRQTAETDLCYLPYWFEPAKRRHVALSFPNKFETYMAAGRPVLFHGPQYAGIARVVRERGVGVCVHSLEAATVAAVLERLAGEPQLLNRLGRAARRAFRAEFNARAMMRSFAALIGVEPALLQCGGSDP